MTIIGIIDRPNKSGMIELRLMAVKSGVSEYFCCSCRQLRLSCIEDKLRCGNCKSKDIIVGPIGSLDKAKLIKNLAKDG